MRKPAAKMIEALVDLFNSDAGQLHTDTVSAIPQDMARELERVEEAEELSYRDAGLVEGTAAILAEGRGSAIVNLADGARAWTPVDRVGEFDRASRRAPEAAWEKPAIAVTATGSPEGWPGAWLSGVVAEFDDAVAQTVAAIPADRLADAAGALFPGAMSPATGFLPALNAALTPGETALLDDVDTADVVYGSWLASAVRPDTAELIARGLAYRGVDRTLYLTAVGAELVKYRRALTAAAKGSEYGAHVATNYAVQAMSPLNVVPVPPGFEAAGDGPLFDSLVPVTGFLPALNAALTTGEVKLLDRPRLVITRLRRGLVISSADRTALADLLDTVRRGLSEDAHAINAWSFVTNTYRAHFGDIR